MGFLDGFKRISIVQGKPSCTLSRNGLTFSKNAVYTLDKATEVDVYINSEEKKLAVKKTIDKTDMSVPFVRGNKDYVRWNSKDFIKIFETWLGWDSESNIRYKIDGEYIADEELICFDFTKAIISTDEEN